MSLNSRDKGQRGERQWRDQLRDAGFQAERCEQYRGGSYDSPDVLAPDVYLCGRPVHFEVKRCERFNIYEAIDQAITDADGSAIPVVAHRRNNRPWLVVMLATDFLKLVRQNSDHDANAQPPIAVRIVDEEDDGS